MAQPTRITQDAIVKRVQQLMGRKLTKSEQQIVNLSVAVNSAINSLVQEQRSGVVPKSPGSSSADRSTSIEGATIQKS